MDNFVFDDVLISFSPNQSGFWRPITHFVTEGGGNFPVHDPIIFLIDQVDKFDVNVNF